MERYLGLDVQASSCTLAVLSESGRLVRTQVVDRAWQLRSTPPEHPTPPEPPCAIRLDAPGASLARLPRRHPPRIECWMCFRLPSLPVLTMSRPLRRPRAKGGGGPVLWSLLAIMSSCHPLTPRGPS